MYLFVLNLLVILIYICQKTRRNFHMLQQNFYNENSRYIKWVNNNIVNVLLTSDIYILIIVVIFSLLNFKYINIITLIYYLLCNYLYYKKIKKEQVKIPLKVTSRIKRLYVTLFILYSIIFTLILINYNNEFIYLYYIVIELSIIINFLFVYLANIINVPIEKLVYLYYKNKAINKLNSLTKLEVIGITGSYGKTSSKNILNEILNTKFDSVTTPKNFNTKYGLIITINNNIDKYNDYFVSEMGAFKKGDIKKLCNLVKPKYGILTTIGEAHLDSFGSVENIIKGKFELIESLPSDGVAVLNKDDERQRNYKLKNNCNILWIGIDNTNNTYLYADNIKMSYKGMSFDCHFKDDKKAYAFETKLLGKPNIYNILGSIALGKYLGIEIERLQLGVKQLKSIEHRLELKKVNSINIIDDAYNSNPIGSSMALDVLNLMPGKKIIVTPGMIELKDKLDYYNKEFGKHIAGVCDEVILVGKKQTKFIYEGLMTSKYNKEKIHVINDVKEAFNIINGIKEKNTYVLLENDLPDMFNER